MVPKKYKSKRISLSHKYKIEKKIRASKKKSNQKTPARSLKKIKESIPNKCPFKNDILSIVEKEREIKEQERLRRINGGVTDTNDVEMEETDELAKLVNDAQEKQALFDQAATNENPVDSVNDTNANEKTNTSIKKLLKISSIIIMVLDARDPLSTLLTFPTEDKEVLLVLNKCDLIPPEFVTKWLEYFTSKGYSILPFSKTGNKEKDGYVHKLLSKIQKMSQGKKSIVGIVGYSNVGKSSLINSILSYKKTKKSNVCGVSSEVNYTKGEKIVKVTKNVYVVDSVGVLSKSGNGVSCLSVDEFFYRLESAKNGVSGGLVETLCKVYKIPYSNTIDDILIQIGRLRGMLKRGGVVDIDGVRNLVYKDFVAGVVPYYVAPPKIDNKENINEECKIVKELGEEFKIDGVCFESKDSDFVNSVGVFEESDDEESEGNEDESDCMSEDDGNGEFRKLVVNKKASDNTLYDFTEYY